MKYLSALLVLAMSTLSIFPQGGTGTTPTVRYNTVAEMVAATVQNVPANSRLSALVTGRVTANDGGGGVFYFTSASATATNLGTVFPSTGVAGRWIRGDSDVLNALWFSGADVGLKVNNAMSALGANGGTIRIPSGTYTGASTMLLTNSPAVTLIGDGFQSTKITFTGSGIQCGNSVAETKIKVSGLGLYGPDTGGNGSTYGVFVTPGNTVHTIVSDNYLTYFKTNVIWGHTSGGAFGGLVADNEIQVFSNQIGISVGYNAAATSLSRNRIQGFNGSSDTGSVGVLIHGGAGYDAITIEQGFIEGMGRQVVITNDYGNIVNVTISGVHFEEGGTAGGAASVGVDVGGSITSISIRECVFLESTAGAGPSACTNAIVIRDGVKNFSWRDNYTFNHLGNAVRNLNTDAVAGYSIIGGKSFDALSPVFDSFIGVDFNLNGRDNINVIKAMTNSTIYVTNLFQSPNLTVTSGTVGLGSSTASPTLFHTAGDGVLVTRPSSYAVLTLTGVNTLGGVIQFKDSGGVVNAEIDGFGTAAGEDPNFWIRTSGTKRWGILSGSSTLHGFGASTVQTSTGILTLNSDTYVKVAGAGILSADIGFRVNNGATSGNYLRGNGTSFVSSSIQAGDIPTTVLTSGTYTPTLSNVANLDSSTAFTCQYSRVGSVVTVSGKVTVDPTTTLTLTQLGISLPIASALTQQEQVGGSASASNIASQSAAVRGDATNDRAEMVWVTADVTSQPMYFSYTYLVQ